MSLLSDLLEAAVSGVKKPAVSSKGDSTTNPEFASVFDEALSSPDTANVMETQNMTQVGNPSDIAGVAAEMSAQAASPEAVNHRQAAGEAFEAIKDSLQDPVVADLMETPAGVGDQVAAQDVQPLSAGAPSTDDALTLSMMAAGQGSRVSQQFSNRPVLTVSASTASPGATPPGITPAGNALSNTTGSATSVDATGSISQESFLNPDSKMMDSLLTPTRETTRLSQTEFISEQRPAVAAVGAATTNTAGIGGIATKQSAFIEQPLDLTQSNKQQQATEMATHVRVLKNQGGGEAKINLHPAELGRMSISVSTDATDTKVSFVVETSQARQVVEAAMPRLKELLEQSGLSLADSDVTEQHKQSADEKRTDRTPLSPSLESPDAGMVESELTLSVVLDPSRLLDAYA